MRVTILAVIEERPFDSRVKVSTPWGTTELDWSDGVPEVGAVRFIELEFQGRPTVQRNERPLWIATGVVCGKLELDELGGWRVKIGDTAIGLDPSSAGAGDEVEVRGMLRAFDINL